MLTRLRMERFKSFARAELTLGPFSVLVGTNASGKSNIRDALRFLHGIGRGYSLADIIGGKYSEGDYQEWRGIPLPSEWRWSEVREELNPKETYFEPLARQRGLRNEPGEGRRTLPQEAASRYQRLRQLCPEDLARLEERLHVWINRPG